ncbi:hypothetical protein E2C01_078801 [Portunus trituberculatus]|uniref:Uncharacterized protein n=1 Tax=Portunus trituberculatus TaxID=210409 RepID=A0A5B7INP0_PORTR|nr:hypothetical protein [Portunus trituberculatus]
MRKRKRRKRKRTRKREDNIGEEDDKREKYMTATTHVSQLSDETQRHPRNVSVRHYGQIQLYTYGHSSADLTDQLAVYPGDAAAAAATERPPCSLQHTLSSGS